MNYVDTVFLPAMPMSKAYETWFTLPMAHPISSGLGVADMNHVLYRIEPVNPILFRFYELFDSSTKVLLFISIIFYVVTNKLLQPNSVFNKYIWFYLITIFYPTSFIQGKRDCFLAAFWTLLISFILNQYFQGVYFSEVSTVLPPIVIDSLDELVERNDLKIAAIEFDTEGEDDKESAPEDYSFYFYKKDDYKSKLQPRLKIITIGDIVYFPYQVDFLKNISEGKIAFIGGKIGSASMLKNYFLKEAYKNFSNIHESRNGDYIQPYFLSILDSASYHDKPFKIV